MDSSSPTCKQCTNPIKINLFSVHVSSLKQFYANLLNFLENVPWKFTKITWAFFAIICTLLYTRKT